MHKTKINIVYPFKQALNKSCKEKLAPNLCSIKKLENKLMTFSSCSTGWCEVVTRTPRVGVANSNHLWPRLIRKEEPIISYSQWSSV